MFPYGFMEKADYGPFILKGKWVDLHASILKPQPFTFHLTLLSSTNVIYLQF